MAQSLNKVTLIGNLGKDPEIRNTQAGDKIANFTLATTESWKDRASGERKERTEWHRITIFGDGLSNVAEQYLKKGSKVYVEGALQTRKWTDQAGQDRYTTEIVLQPYNGKLLMLDNNGAQPRNGARGENTGEGSGYLPNRGDLDDDIPFAPQVL